MKPMIKVIILAVLSLPRLVWGQDVNYNKVVFPDDAYSIPFEERLVRLAWRNNPASHIAQDEVMVSQYEYKAAKSHWTGMLGVQGNLNEFTIKKFTGDNTLGSYPFYPRYNISLNLPMSAFFEQPKMRKAAQTKWEATSEKVKQLKLELRALVLKAYSEFQKYEQILGLRREALDEEESNFILVEQKFKKGEASYDDYARIQRSRNELKILVVTAESDYSKSKLDLEALIGVRFDEVK